MVTQKCVGVAHGVLLEIGSIEGLLEHGARGRTAAGACSGSLVLIVTSMRYRKLARILNTTAANLHRVEAMKKTRFLGLDCASADAFLRHHASLEV
jgi:hypothetical protein